MRTIHLNLAESCPCVLAQPDSDHVIGCAMGEVLFQAGIPLSIFMARRSASTILLDHPDYRRQLARFLDLPDLTTTHLSTIDEVEKHFDRMKLAFDDGDNYHIDKYDLIYTGRRLNIEFIISTDVPMTITHCPLETPSCPEPPVKSSKKPSSPTPLPEPVPCPQRAHASTSMPTLAIAATSVDA